MKVSDLLTESESFQLPKETKIYGFVEELKAAIVKAHGKHMPIQARGPGRIWTRSTGGRYQDPASLLFDNTADSVIAWKLITSLPGKSLEMTDEIGQIAAKNYRPAFATGKWLFIKNPSSISVMSKSKMQNRDIYAVKRDKDGTKTMVFRLLVSMIKSGKTVHIDLKDPYTRKHYTGVLQPPHEDSSVAVMRLDGRFDNWFQVHADADEHYTIKQDGDKLTLVNLTPKERRAA